MVEREPRALKKNDLLLLGINTVITETALNLLENYSFCLFLQK